MKVLSHVLAIGLLVPLLACDGAKDSSEETGVVGDVDADGDGFLESVDCDDDDPDVNPAAIELCDGIDNDCDGETDEADSADAETWYADSDDDGFGDADNGEAACAMPSGYTKDDQDCDDTDSSIYPGADEYCDGVDNDCDGEIDEDDAVDQATWYADADGDGYGDEDDTTDACDQPTGYVEDATDCDDGEITTNPGATEYCDGVDNDCDGTVDEDDSADALTWYMDDDSDGYGDSSVTSTSCSQPSGWVSDATDCDDGETTTNPGATEYCDGVDNDCDGTVDEDDAADASTWYADSDSDSYGNSNTSTQACSQPSGYVADNTDCDDLDADTNPAASEYCDGHDDDCDGTIDEDDAVDATTWYRDADGDSYGHASMSSTECNQPSGFVADNTDCDDGEYTTNPGATEYCDGVDNDCDGTVDEGTAADASTWYRDLDEDGFGNPNFSVSECDEPSGFVADNTDCDDGDDSVYPAERADDDDGDGFGAEGSTTTQCYGVDNEHDCDDTDSSEPIVVDTSGSASGDGSAGNPLDSIQDAILVSSSCVIVYAGTYEESIDFGGSDISVTGVDGAESTFIDGTGSGDPVVSIMSGETNASLAGFTLAAGDGYLEEASTTTWCTSISQCTDYYSSYCGGGFYIADSTATLEEVIVSGNSLPSSSTSDVGDDTYYVFSYGGGGCVVNGTATLSGVVVEDNYADQGGGLFVDEDSSVTFSGGWFQANSATDGGGVQVDGGYLSVENAVMAWNYAVDDGGSVLVTDGQVVLGNATVAGSSSNAGTGAELFLDGSSTGTVENSILYGSGSASVLYAFGIATLDGTYNNVYSAAGSTTYDGASDLTGTDGNLSEDPYFAGVSDDGDSTNDNWTLSNSSSCIDAGNPAASYNDADGSTCDMGAYGGPDADWDQ